MFGFRAGPGDGLPGPLHWELSGQTSQQEKEARSVVLVSPSLFLHLLTFASAQRTATTLNTRANYQPNTNPVHTKN